MRDVCYNVQRSPFVDVLVPPPPPWVDNSWRRCIGWPEDPGDGGTSGVNRGEIGVKLKAIRRVLGLGGTAPPLPFPIPLG